MYNILRVELLERLCYLLKIHSRLVFGYGLNTPSVLRHIISQSFRNMLVHCEDRVSFLKIVFQLDTEFTFEAKLENFYFIQRELTHWVVDWLTRYSL